MVERSPIIPGKFVPSPQLVRRIALPIVGEENFAANAVAATTLLTDRLDMLFATFAADMRALHRPGLRIAEDNKLLPVFAHAFFLRIRIPIDVQGSVLEDLYQELVQAGREGAVGGAWGTLQEAAGTLTVLPHA